MVKSKRVSCFVPRKTREGFLIFIIFHSETSKARKKMEWSRESGWKKGLKNLNEGDFMFFHSFSHNFSSVNFSSSSYFFQFFPVKWNLRRNVLELFYDRLTQICKMLLDVWVFFQHNLTVQNNKLRNIQIAYLTFCMKHKFQKQFTK